jgi:hypothetical protein
MISNFQLKSPFIELWRFIGHEKLRMGTMELIAELRVRQFDVWIYTTSFRSPWYLRKLFWLMIALARHFNFRRGIFLVNSKSWGAVFPIIMNCWLSW